MMEEEKPNASALSWEIGPSVYPFANKMFKIRADSIAVRGKRQIEYAYVERPPAVVIVPITRDGQVVMMRQYRYPVDEWCLEIPAGSGTATDMDSLKETARRELREEIGATSVALTSVGSFYSAPSLTDEEYHVFLAENVELSEQPRPEASEEIQLSLVDPEKAIESARTGMMKNSVCALALLLSEPVLKTRGYL